MPDFLYSLPDALRGPAERFFGEPLGDVTVVVGDTPTRLGALALAGADVLYLTPELLWLPTRSLMAVLGHELTHVIQLRRGRVSAARRGEPSLVADAACEREAEALGEAFAAAAPLAPCWHIRPGAPPSRVGGVLPLIAVGGVPLPAPRLLSSRAAQILAWIADGPAWLAWAIGTTAPRYEFPGEAALLAAIQLGLHGSPLTFLPRLELQVAPQKLMTLSDAALQVLAGFEAGSTGSVVEVQARKILADADLLGERELAVGRRFLAEIGVADAPLLRTLSLADQIGIYELVRDSRGAVTMRADLQHEAAAFAVDRAVTPLEFVDLYKAYLVLTARLALLDGTEAARGEAVQRTFAALRPGLCAALDGPQLPLLAPPAEVQRVVRGCASLGRRVGFPRLSAGVVQLVQNTRFDRQVGAEATALIDRCMQESQAFLDAYEPAPPRLGQDGERCFYRVDGGTLQAELVRDESGVLTLRTFRFTPPANPAAEATNTEETPS